MLLQSSMRSVPVARIRVHQVNRTARRRRRARCWSSGLNTVRDRARRGLRAPRLNSAQTADARATPAQTFVSPDPNIYRTIRVVEDLEQAILEGWTRVKHKVLSDPLELRR